MTTKSRIKNIVLSLIVLSLTVVVMYYADSPVNQSVVATIDSQKS